MFRELLLVGLGGFAGSALRYFVGRWFAVGFPWGTLVVNISGCLVIGLVYALAERGNLSSPALRLLLTVGFCGGFTTFSAFMSENFAMLRAGEFLPFALYTAGSFLLGFAALWLGWQLAK